MPTMVAGMFPCSKKEPGAHSAPGNACKHGLKNHPKKRYLLKKMIAKAIIFPVRMFITELP